MTLLIKLEDGSPVDNPIAEQNFRQIFPRTSFPKYLTADVVESFGYGIYDYSSPPELTRYQKVTETTPIKSSEGIWKQTWQVSEMTSEEQTEKNNEKAQQVRLQRNSYLLASDWSQLADSPVDATTWATYRQALRNITEHENFPWLNDEDWPEKPE